MVDLSFLGGAAANTPESVKARIAAARLLQQGAAAPSAPYTSGAVVGLKALEGLLGGLQERQAMQSEIQGRLSGNQQMVDLANALRNGVPSPAAVAAAGQSPATGIPGSAAAAAAASTSASATQSPISTASQNAFVQSALPHAQAVSAQTGIDPRLIVAQAALESNFGKSAPGGNLFGIKATGGQASTGPIGTKESVNGTLTPTLASFAAYGTPEASFAGYGKLMSGARYAGVRNGATLDDQLAALGKSGYATDPNYAAKVGAIARGIDPGISATPRTAAGQLAATPGSTVAPQPGVGNRDPGIAISAAPIPDSAALTARNRLASGQGNDADRALVSSYMAQQNAPAGQQSASADAPAPNAQPVASNTLPPGVTPDMVSAPPPSPYGAMLASMAQPPSTPDAAAMAAALRGSASGTTPAALASPFGAAPGPIAPQAAADPAMVAALLKQGGAGSAPAPQQTPPLSPNALAMGDLMPGGPGPSALDPSGAALPPLPATGLSTGALPGFDNVQPGGQVQQSSVGDSGFTGTDGAQAGVQYSTPGGLQDGSVITALQGNLPPPQQMAVGAADIPPAPQPDPAALAAALRQGAGSAPPVGPSPAPAPAPTPAPPPQQPSAPALAAAAMPGSVDDFGRTPDQAMAAAAPSLPDVTTAAMAKAGYDTTGLPGAAPKPPAAPLPMLAAADVPPPADPSAAPAPTPTPTPAPALPIMARQSSNPPAALRQDFAGLGQPQSAPTAPAALPQTGPLPPPGVQSLAAAQTPAPDAPAPNAAQAGPAPVSPQMAASLLRQPNGLPGQGGGDPSSAQAFMRQEAMRAQGGQGFASPAARVLAGQGAAPFAPAQPQDGGSPLDAIGRLFGGGGASQGGNPLASLPLIGNLFGGAQGQGQGGGTGLPFQGGSGSVPASSPALGGQGQAQFTPGGQGAQPAAGMGQARAIAGAILANPYASPQAQEAASKVLFAMPQMEKMEDGTLVSYDPYTRQSTVIGRYGKAVDLAPGHALRDPYTGAPIGATQPENPKFSMNRDGVVLNDNTGEVKNGGGGYRFMTEQEKQAAGIPLDQPVQVGPNGQMHAATGQTINVGADQQTNGQQIAKTLGENHVALMTGVDANRTKLRDLNLMSGALQRLQQNGGTTGMGAEEVGHLQSALNTAANSLGLGQQFDVSDKEAIGKVARQISGAAAKDIGGARTTNFDMQQMLEANPGLALSPTGNQRMLGIAQQVTQRNIDVGQQMQDAAALAVQQGRKPDPVAMEAIRQNYDQQHHIVDPITGQDLSASAKLPEFQSQGSAANPSTPTGAAQGPNMATPTATPPVLTPDQARAAPPGTVFMTQDGRRMVR